LPLLSMLATREEQSRLLSPRLSWGIIYKNNLGRLQDPKCTMVSRVWHICRLDLYLWKARCLVWFRLVHL
jgi:hypothetical protein